MSTRPTFVLASASPRRRELLQQIGAVFAVQSADVDETPLPNEAPGDYVSRLAEAKAVAASNGVTDLPVLGADTTVVIDGQAMGKPRDESDCVAMLMALSGRTHCVLTAVAMVHGGRREQRLVETRVQFRRLTPPECRRYWATGEPRDKAGGYGIQGLGSVFVSRIEGSYSSVVGLPLAETWELLQLFDLPCWVSGESHRP
ncbi:MAG: septum formation inhibitor Maf [Porticoccaceae bacterium]|nr:septum formation inhibitor Maf [Porticoccaceae bacterium]